MTPGTALIAGGGIGGTAAALALALQGWSVRVFEQAAKLEEVGAGVQIGPNGIKVLEALGAMAALEPFVFEPDYIEMRDGPSGRQIFRLPMKGYAEARWGARYLQVHRADLLKALSARLADVAGDIVTLGARAKGYRTTAQGAVLILEDETEHSADLLIAADGVRSVLRDQMFGADLRFSGNVAWRAIVPTEPLKAPPPPSGCVWAGPGKHAVTTCLRKGSLTNFVGIVEESEWREEGWSVPGRREDALAHFADWHPLLEDILDNATVLHRWALCERPALKTWSDGHVVLMGDAAHPMLPSMAQGAVQAIEDAWRLSAELLNHDTIPSALRGFETLRVPRATKVQKRSAFNLQLFHRTGASRVVSQAGLKGVGFLAPGLLHRQQDWIYGHDVTIRQK